MSDTTCHSDTCSNVAPRYYYRSAEATDSGGAGSAINTDAGQENPNCPEGYHWGGTDCINDVTPTGCSEGYKWDGTECIEDDDNFECATGYYEDADGNCTACNLDPSVTCVTLSGEGLITVTVTSTAATDLTVYMSLDGGATWDQIEIIHAASGTTSAQDLAEYVADGTVYVGGEIGFRVTATTASCEETSPSVFVIYFNPAAYPRDLFGNCT